MISSELSAKMSIWRAKAAEGTLSIEEQREAVAFMRGERKGAAISSEQAKRTKAKKEIKSAEELLGELGI